ncbi:TIGR03086 family metal-binding protein [Actinomycetospora sp. C-140]
MIDLTPACRELATLVAGIDDARRPDPTPCPDMTVGDVIAHLEDVAAGFTAIATGHEQPRRPDLPAALDALASAWADPAAWEGETAGPGVALPAATWGRIALTEVVVHGWDLARATDRPFAPPDTTLEACLAHVRDFVPRAPLPELWGTPVRLPDDAPLLDRVVAGTGRRPG